MLDLAKSAFLLVFFLAVFLILGGLVLRALKTDFSLSLALPAGFFFYHLLFSIVALPCILTGQSLSLLIGIWIPLLVIVLALAALKSGHIVTSYSRARFRQARQNMRKPTVFLLPALAVIAVVLVLYLSISSYYMGWDTAFYVRTVLHAVENGSMYTLDATSGAVTHTLSLRYALSPFYMNSAIVCRVMRLHPLLVQNLVDGSICVLLAFTIIYRIGMLLFHGDRQKACLAVLFAVMLHLTQVSLFSSSEFLILRSYEAKAFCANVVLPFAFSCVLVLWRSPDDAAGWQMLFLCAAAANAVSLSSLFTVPLLLGCFAAAWFFTRSWKALRNTVICMIPGAIYIFVYLLEYIGVLLITVK